MKVLGITGAAGAGKSRVLAHLEEQFGARVIQADLVAHHLEEPGQNCYRRIVEAFGEEILRGDGTIDRELLGGIVYRDREKLEVLNGLVHPSVKAWIREEIAREQSAGRVPFVAVEAALLLEDHYEEICDEIWYVCADEAERVRRLSAERGYPMEKIRALLKNQKKDEEYRAGCDFVIDNSGDFVENTVGQIGKGLVEHGFL